jgi:hypothetical protein
MKTETEINLMIARIEGRIEGISALGGDTYSNEMILNALKWVIGEVEKI